ncbi:MAG: recombination regulator RecX [Solirubrobacteraceae bacterium]|nr:recombination regulator RecX [Solirubrobacteraceae bacterium]
MGEEPPSQDRAVTHEERVQATANVAYRFLAKRDRTVAEVRTRLERDDPPAAVVDEVLGEMLELGYLDDARYAARFVEDRRTLDGWGDERIDGRLRALGVGRSLIDAALADAGGDQLDAALTVLRRRWSEPPRDDRERARALGVLARKGYPSDVAYAAVRALGRGAR